MSSVLCPLLSSSPMQVSPYAEEPCEKCNCNMRGSLSPACIRDDKHASPEKGLIVGHVMANAQIMFKLFSLKGLNELVSKFV